MNARALSVAIPAREQDKDSIMEYYNNKLCATCEDLRAIVNYDTLKKMVSRGKAERVRRPSAELPALYAVDSLPLKYKTEVYHRYPDMKAQAESRPFMESIEPDGAALHFFQTYRLDDGKFLPTEKQTEYANNAAVLNAFRTVLERSDSQHRRQSKRCINKCEFWRKAAEALPRIADAFPHSLPGNPRRLRKDGNKRTHELSGQIHGHHALQKHGDFENCRISTKRHLNIIQTGIKPGLSQQSKKPVNYDIKIGILFVTTKYLHTKNVLKIILFSTFFTYKPVMPDNIKKACPVSQPNRPNTNFCQ